jgi:hypothetical protein
MSMPCANGPAFEITGTVGTSTKEDEPMSEQTGGPDDMRASNADREAIVARLNDACGEGRLTLAEFSERVENLYELRTQGELERLVADLPAARAEAAVPATQPAGRTQWHVSPVGGLHQRGQWRMAPKTVAVSVIGGVNLDLGEAELEAPVVTLTKVSIIGGVSLRVPPGVRVEVSGFSLIGGRSMDIDDAPPGSPTVRIRHFGIIGGVSARSTRPLDRWRKAIGRRRG